MKNLLAAFFVICGLDSATAQSAFNYSNTRVQTIESEFLNESREIWLRLPWNYEEEPDASFPLLITFDGKLTFDYVAGTCNFMSEYDKMPGVIVVGVPHENRYEDMAMSVSGNEDRQADQFYRFVTEELVNWLEANYRVNHFKTLVGHSLGGGFITKILLNKPDDFDAYIAISPYVSATVQEKIDSLQNSRVSWPVYYYICSGINDLSGHIESWAGMKKLFRWPAEEFEVAFDFFEDYTHGTYPVRALPEALSFIFKNYQEVPEDIFEKMGNGTLPALVTLKTHYSKMNSEYGIRKKPRIHELVGLGWALIDNGLLEEAEAFGKYATREYPESGDLYYILGGVEETKKNYKAALENYKKGYSLLSDDVSNKADFYEDISRLEAIIAGEKE